MPLTRDEITEIGHRVRRAGAANCWTGTSGTIAADARRLIVHIEETKGVCEYPVDHILRGEAELKASRHYLGDEMAPDEAAILTEDDVAEVAHETRKAANIGGGDVVPAVDEVASRKAATVRMAPSQAEPWKHVPADMTAWCEQAKANAGPPAAVRLLDTARAAVVDRHAVYGPPQEHFARTVGMVNSLFSSVLRRPLTTADWARIMLLDKLARDLGPRPHADNAVDLAGYAACLAECQSAPPPG